MKLETHADAAAKLFFFDIAASHLRRRARRDAAQPREEEK